MDSINKINSGCDGMTDDKLNDLVTKTSETLAFNGVAITKCEYNDNDVLEYSVIVSKSERYKPLEDVLSLTYWSLWCLSYGEYSEEKTMEAKIILHYKEVE